ncbi:MAG TPA: hypothetical protein VEJ16_14660 [Alphaproteobacteria bacterium]|nr:hypothetical protein [Alphaproteobacteria bacterium]
MTKKRVERFRRTNGRQLCFVASAVAATLAACCIGMLADGTPASAHGVAGDRVFPATIVIDDPAVGDELSLPTFSTIHNSATNGNVGSREFDYGAEWDKTITEDLGVNFNFDYTVLNFDDGTNASGWQDPAFTLKYKLYVNPEHEILTSVGVIRTFGGTGSSTVDNPIGSTTPTIYVGKGLGDLPVDILRPFAITGEFQYQVSDQTTAQANQWIIGGSLQYSIPYLQQHVKDMGLPEMVSRMIPIVEYSITVPSNGAPGGAVTGTIAPGVLYEGDAWQLGLEALIPATSATKTNVGAIAQFHLYLDDIFPDTIGKPIFGN